MRTEARNQLGSYCRAPVTGWTMVGTVWNLGVLEKETMRLADGIAHWVRDSQAKEHS